MLAFSLTTVAPASVEEVWKLLHDPSRFPDWWCGIGAVRPGEGGAYTMWPEGWPDHPMDQRLSAERGDGRVTISCLVSDIEFIWRLSEAPGGTGVEVEVLLPESEAHRTDTQRQLLQESLRRLSALAVQA